MKSPKSFVYGIVLGLIGIILFSSKAVMVKLAYQYEVDAISVLLFRMLFSFPFYVVIAIIFRHKNSDTDLVKKDYLWVFFFGFVGYYLSSYFDFLGLIYIKASLERIILFIYPTIVILFNRVFLKQAVSKNQIYAIILTYIGIIIAFWNEVAISGNDTYLGGFFIVLCAVTYAAYLSGSGWLIPKFGVAKFTAYVMIVSCICVFIHYGISHKMDLLNYSWQVYFLGFLLAVFATVIPSFLVSASIKLISSSNFAVIAAVGPISTIILAAIFLNEQLTLLQLLGAFAVIIGISLVSLSKKN
ncbi:MAG: DMT family transporter [Flavobacteriales bacterium]|nr:DMT family transporter [Flavobacteriia bacterium]NCP06395.1 DMT family transporter [Flavobacteriales bacterium]PIV94702.1 MAG: EamA family transporter [Flavobacteriaceae bacterium CG17_big_fil_post_rev_8_21_14_2_50_33_15]PIY10875.1 MAG: EamA family transporter [Flavobacteriaceae bacterium CG_4_10_14_3_um_filter_33_47]PJB20576.1 MAG: EamA family transporter [Flavobacteriaceae bacterium CG_4_9_14_3_um_filter_33_16]